MADVERAFAAHGQPLHAAPVHVPIAGHMRLHIRAVLVNRRNFAKTFSSLTVIVFDSDASAASAQRSLPWFTEQAASIKTTTSAGGGTMTESSGFVHRQGDVIAAGGADRWPAVRAALATVH